MTIIPVSHLTVTELLRLGNNLRPALRKDRRELLAINRSLATHDEQVQRLHRPSLNAGSWAGITGRRPLSRLSLPIFNTLFGRMSAEVMRVLASDRPAVDGHYTTTLFAEAETQGGACTAKSTVYTASIAAGLMVGQFARWLRGLAVDRDVMLNLLAGEMVLQ